eukprot:664897-Prymnesium_polylepis.1
MGNSIAAHFAGDRAVVKDSPSRTEQVFAATNMDLDRLSDTFCLGPHQRPGQLRTGRCKHCLSGRGWRRWRGWRCRWRWWAWRGDRGDWRRA